MAPACPWLARRPPSLSTVVGMAQESLDAASEPSAQPQLPPVQMALSPRTQLAGLSIGYALHILWLSTLSFRLPFKGLALAAEDALGAAGLLLVLGRRRRPTLPRLPWGSEARTSKAELVETGGTLLCAYLLSGYAGAIIRSVLNGLTALGLPITSGCHRALEVLCSHLAWVFMAVRVLGMRLRPFFPAPFGQAQPEGEGRWLTIQWRAPWLLYALSGYFASLVCYNSVEAVNRCLLPPNPPGLTPVDESLVAQLVHPEGGDRLALALGAVGPCVTAPIFEEVLYRGFLLPALCRFMPLRTALPLHALLFGVHHHALVSLLPLSALGLLWGVLYLRSGNLIVPILVHALWNSRIFISSLLEQL